MKRTALAGLFVCAAMLASPVFAAGDLCQDNLQDIHNKVATLEATSVNTKNDINALIEKAKTEQAAGNIKECIATTTQALQKLQNLDKGGEAK